MKLNTQELIAELIVKTKVNITRAEAFKNLPASILNYKENTESWSTKFKQDHLKKH